MEIMGEWQSRTGWGGNQTKLHNTTKDSNEHPSQSNEDEPKGKRNYVQSQQSDGIEFGAAAMPNVGEMETIERRTVRFGKRDIL